MSYIPEHLQIIQRLSNEKSMRFGETFLVKQRANETLLVLKTIDKSNKVGYEQLKNEATFSFQIKGLPEILAEYETETAYCFLRNYEEGIRLSVYWEKVKKRKRLSVLKSVVQALAPLFSELKNLGIVHGDVKPENILVNDSNGQMDCSLIDFGLAFYENHPPERKTLFQLAYSAPEIILNRLHCADQSSDVFSFCLIVYKLLTGRLPFSEGNPALLTQLQITYPIERPFLFKKKIWHVLEKGLKKHQFKKAPNHYSKEVLEQFLRENNRLRYPSFTAFCSDFTSI